MLEALEVRDVPSSVTGTLYITDSTPWGNIKVGQAVTITLSSSNGSADAGATVDLTINDAGHTNSGTKTLGSDGTFSWTRTFTYAGKVTITDNTQLDGTYAAYPDTFHALPIIGIGEGGVPSDGSNTPYWFTPNRALGVGGTEDITLVAYNADSTLASNYNGYVTLESARPGALGLMQGTVAYRADGTVYSTNSVATASGLTYHFHNGLAGAELEGLRSVSVSIALTAFSSDSSGNALADANGNDLSSQVLYFTVH
jgi:hypothetical protein